MTYTVEPRGSTARYGERRFIVYTDDPHARIPQADVRVFSEGIYCHSCSSAHCAHADAVRNYFDRPTGGGPA